MFLLNDDVIYHILLKMESIDLHHLSQSCHYFESMCTTLCLDRIKKYENRKDIFDLIDYNDEKELCLILEQVEPYFSIVFNNPKHQPSDNTIRMYYNLSAFKCHKYKGHINMHNLLNKSSLPRALHKLKNIKEYTAFNYSNENLSQIWWSGVSHASKIIFSGNNLCDIAAKEISCMSSLTYLNLRNNKLRNMDWILEVPHLSYLDVRENFISDVPEEISYLYNLKYFDLGYNIIEVFPKILTKIKTLQVLGLSGNLLTYIPKSISELTNLKILLLHGYDDSCKLFEETSKKCRKGVVLKCSKSPSDYDNLYMESLYWYTP